MEFSSKLIQNAVNEISQLPGIGKRTALRLALHMLRQEKTQTEDTHHRNNRNKTLAYFVLSIAPRTN